MFILNQIDVIPDDLQNLPDQSHHKLTFQVLFTIKGVPDSFTGTVFDNAQGEMQLQHFNNPRGNKRKVITLKNKLISGGFDTIKKAVFAQALGQGVSLPQQIEVVQRRISGTPRLEKANKAPK